MLMVHNVRHATKTDIILLTMHVFNAQLEPPEPPEYAMHVTARMNTKTRLDRRHANPLEMVTKRPAIAPLNHVQLEAPEPPEYVKNVALVNTNLTLNKRHANPFQMVIERSAVLKLNYVRLEPQELEEHVMLHAIPSLENTVLLVRHRAVYVPTENNSTDLTQLT